MIPATHQDSAGALAARPDRAPIGNRGERGSAYLIALLVMVVLTMLGLSLALVTQTETQIAANQRAATRLFYAADAAIAPAIALLMTGSVLENGDIIPDLTCQNVIVDEKTAPGGAQLTDFVEITPMVQIAEMVCNLCEFPTRQGDKTVKSSHAIRNNAAQAAISGTDVYTLTQASVGVMLEFEPFSQAALQAAINQLYNDPGECGINNLGGILTRE